MNQAPLYRGAIYRRYKMYGKRCENCSGEDCVCCEVYLEAMADDRAQYYDDNDATVCDYCQQDPINCKFCEYSHEA